MRASLWAAVLAGLVLAAPAWGQRAVTFGGSEPARIVDRPVNTSNAELPIAQPQRAPQRSSFLTNLLPRLKLPAARPVHGFSQFPTPSNMPGPNYLKQFNIQFPQQPPRK